jgi:hypothetical protein
MKYRTENIWGAWKQADDNVSAAVLQGPRPSSISGAGGMRGRAVAALAGAQGAVRSGDTAAGCDPLVTGVGWQGRNKGHFFSQPAMDPIRVVTGMVNNILGDFLEYCSVLDRSLCVISATV